MKLPVFFLVLIFLFSACNKHEKVDYFEGILIYETDDQMLNNVPVDSGKFIKYYVKGDSVRVESFTAMGKQIHLRNHTTQQGYLIFVYGGKKIALSQDFSKDTIKRGFALELTKESIEVSDVFSEKAIISGSYLNEPIELYYSPYYPNNIIDIYDRIIPGLPTKYKLLVQNIPVNYTLVKLEQKTIDSNKFSVPKDCLVMTMEEFMELLSNQEFIE